MTDTTNPRTPQPGDVWENQFGYRFIARDHSAVVDDRCFVNIVTGRIAGHRLADVRKHHESWRYLGRASDLIGEALKNREKPKGRKVRGDQLGREITPDDMVWWNGRRCAVFEVITQLEDDDTGELVDAYKIVTFCGDDKLSTLANLEVWVEDPKEHPND